jgi:hypothetical protein
MLSMHGLGNEHTARHMTTQQRNRGDERSAKFISVQGVS